MEPLVAGAARLVSALGGDVPAEMASATITQFSDEPRVTDTVALDCSEVTA